MEKFGISLLSAFALKATIFVPEPGFSHLEASFTVNSVVPAIAGAVSSVRVSVLPLI